MKIDILPPTDKQYQDDRIKMALSYSPRIYPCGKCGWAVMTGYCCDTCGDMNPNMTIEEEAKHGYETENKLG